MKKVIILIVSILAASLAVISCQKEEVSNTNLGEKIVSFSAVPIDTRTAFGAPSGITYPTLWTTNDSKVKVSLNYASVKDAAVNPSADFKSATFGGSFQDDESGAYTFLALSPASSYVSISDAHSSWNVNINTTQTPLSNSVDESAQILAAVSEKFSEFPDKVSLSFKHVTAYGKISLSNLSLPNGASVASVSLTASENWAGRWYYYPMTNTVAESSASKTITLQTSSTSDIWFACAPVDLGGKTVEVVVTTNTGSTYKKTITIPAGKKFEAGKIASFAVNMQGIGPDDAVVFKRVENVSDLTLNSEVIIVSSSANFALSTTQNANNRASAGIQKTTDSEGKAIITSPGNDVQVLTIGNGRNGGTYSLSTGSGFLCAASSSNNYLRTEETLDANGSWAISINEGIATIVATGSYTRNHIRFNNPSFACYQTGSTTGTAVNIYKKSGTGSGTIDPKTPSSLTISDATTTFTVGDSFVFDGSVTLIYSDNSISELSSDDYSVNSSGVNMSLAGTYNVTVSYNSEINATYQITVKNTGDIGNYYKKVESVTVGKTYLIVASGQNVALPQISASGTQTGTSVSFSNDIILQSESTKSCEMVINRYTGYTGDDYVIGFSVSGNMNYIFGASSTSLNKTSNPVYNSNPTGIWTITKSTLEGRGSFMITNKHYSTRGILFQAGSINKFGGYSTSALTATGNYYAIDLYELVETS